MPPKKKGKGKKDKKKDDDGDGGDKVLYIAPQHAAIP